MPGVGPYSVLRRTAGFDMAPVDVELPDGRNRRSMVHGGKTLKVYRLDGKEIHHYHRSVAPFQRAYSPGVYIECSGNTGEPDCRGQFKTGD
jgi:hypothetical protein